MSLYDSPVAQRDVYSVSRINREARSVLTGAFPLLWVEGEISNLKQYRSGHWYFSLKDEAAQVSCAMFRNRNMHVSFVPQDGMKVILRAKVELYENRGQFQLIAEHMEEAGEGALRRAFDELKEKLKKEGLFETSRKQELPTLPRHIAIVTSPEGAALRDILSVLGRRFPAVPVTVFGVTVQGDKAAPAISLAIDTISARDDIDLVIVARGGGSLEDLWAFNEEIVARAIAACPIPVISGVGHETDFTIADFVADRRAPTPSVAAETAVPDAADIRQELGNQQRQLSRLLKTRLDTLRVIQSGLLRRLASQSPETQLQQRAQRLDDLTDRLSHQQRLIWREREQRLRSLKHRLQQRDPVRVLSTFEDTISHLRHRLALHGERATAALRPRLEHTIESLTRQGNRLYEEPQQRLQHLGVLLDSVSPLATLGRGYAMVTDQKSGRVIEDVSMLSPGQKVETRLARGHFVSTVSEITERPTEEE